MTNSKQKGKRGEREAAELLNAILGKALPHEKVFVDVQAQGGDIVSLAGLSIEVKRHEVLTIGSWWSQAERQADELGTIPVLMYRQNRRAWRICIPAYLLVPSFTGYIELTEVVFAQWLSHWIGKNV